MFEDPESCYFVSYCLLYDMTTIDFLLALKKKLEKQICRTKIHHHFANRGFVLIHFTDLNNNTDLLYN